MANSLPRQLLGPLEKVKRCLWSLRYSFRLGSILVEMVWVSDLSLPFQKRQKEEGKKEKKEEKRLARRVGR